METRLVQLLSSFTSTANDYVLVRLEFALKHPPIPAPPLIERVPSAPNSTLQAEWDKIECQLECIRRYLRNIDDPRGKRAVYDQSFAHLQRTYRELDQYARAVRWVMTVEDRHHSS